MKITDEDVSSFEAKMPSGDNRLINTTMYTGDHIDQIGKGWAAQDSKYKLYIPLAQKEFDLSDPYAFSEGDVIGKISIAEDNLNILKNIGKDNLPFKIIAPMNLGGGHWVNFAVFININKQAKIYYSDSASQKHGPINKINNSIVQEASNVISSSLNQAGIGVINEHTQDINTKLNQKDKVSCGAYCLENAFRIFGESKLGANPSEMMIRSSQLKFLSYTTLRSASVNQKLSDMMYDLAVNNKNLDHKNFRELLDREDFCKLLKNEYSKNDKDINNYKSQSNNALDTIIRNTGIDNIYKTQKNIREICNLILEEKLTVKDISPLIDKKIEKKHDRSIREVELGVAKRLMKIVNVQNLKQFDEYQKKQDIGTNKIINSRDNVQDPKQFDEYQKKQDIGTNKIINSKDNKEGIAVKIINFCKKIYNNILRTYNSIFNERKPSFQGKDSPSNKSDLNAYDDDKTKKIIKELSIKIDEDHGKNDRNQSTIITHMRNRNNNRTQNFMDR